jgi:hypothetical protein
MTLKERKDTGTGQSKHYVLPYREFALEEAVDMS